MKKVLVSTAVSIMYALLFVNPTFAAPSPAAAMKSIIIPGKYQGCTLEQRKQISAMPHSKNLTIYVDKSSWEGYNLPMLEVVTLDNKKVLCDIDSKYYGGYKDMGNDVYKFTFSVSNSSDVTSYIGYQTQSATGGYAIPTDVTVVCFRMSNCPESDAYEIDSNTGWENFN